MSKITEKFRKSGFDGFYAGGRGSESDIKGLALCFGVILAFASCSALAQDDTVSDEAEVKEIEEIVVKGYREVIRNSIAAKKSGTVISDGVSSKDIGNLPATSLGEVMVTIPGVAITRLKGGVSEVAIRGLGPFLSATQFNGRPASNGSGDRSVNFGMFPSEMANKVTVYKTQQADLVEGGIAGVVDVGTVLPLDYSERRILLDAKSSYSEQASSAEGQDGVGWRGTVSYLDQFDLEGGGKLGLSVGVQRNTVDSPQYGQNGSSSWYACDATVEYSANSSGRMNRCTGKQIKPGTDNSDNPFYIVGTGLDFRQETEDDDRDGAYLALQWQPNEDLEFILDSQYSKREQYVEMHELYLGEAHRVSNPVFDDNGKLRSYDSAALISAANRLLERDEEYKAAALNVNWAASDRLQLDLDLSYSDTVRDQVQRRARLRSDGYDIYGDPVQLRQDMGGFSGYVPVSYELSSDDFATVTVDPRFDVTDHSLFSDDLAMRRDSELKEHNVKGFALNGIYDVEGDVIKRLKVGIRVAEETYKQTNNTTRFGQSSRDVDRAVNEKCRIDFPQSNFAENSNTAAITSWATFDILCQFEMYTGATDLVPPEDLRGIGSKDITERTNAVFAMADFETSLGNRELTGNFGVRLVETKVTSAGFRSGLTVEDLGDGSLNLVATGGLDPVKFEKDVFDVLPSVNATLALTPEVLLRGAVYRALARPANSTYGAGRTFKTNSDPEGFTTLEEAVSSVSANGSPGLEPLRAWNADLSLEWYANEDTLLAASVYYKKFEGGQIPVIENETFLIDGHPVTVPVTQKQITDDESTLTGIELQASHTFSYLPAPFDGLGVKAGYNYADTDYEEHDIRNGDKVNITTGEITPGIIPPANIEGFSRNVANAQLFYRYGNLSLQAIYKHRSAYQIGFLSGPRSLRYIGGSDVVDARVTYRLNDNIWLSLQGLNLTDEPRTDSMALENNLRSIHSYGKTYYLGVKMKF